MKKSSICILVIFSIIMLGSLSFAEDFSVSVEYGINNIVKSSGSIPVQIHVTNMGEDFKGRIKIALPIGNYESNYVRYSQEFEISSQSSRDYILNIYLDEMHYGSNGNILIYSEDDKLIYKKEINFNSSVSGNHLVGVLSNDQDGLAYWNGVSINRSYINILDMNDYKFTKFEDLKMLDAVMIDNFDSEKLSVNQIDALKEYILSGKLLIIGTGNHYEKTLNNLEELISIENATIKKSGTDFFSMYSDRKLSEEISFIALTDLNESNIYHRLGNEKNIIVFPFSLSDSNFINYADNKKVLRIIMEDNFKEFFTGEDQLDSNKSLSSKMLFGRSYRLRSDLKRIPEKYFPNMILVLIVLLIFIIMVGPINYLLLKHLKKRKLMLLSTIIISGLFILIIQLTLVSSSLNRDYLNVFSIVELDAEKKLEKQIRYIGAKSNDRSLDLSSPIGRFTQIDEYYSSGSYEIYGDESNHILYEDNQKWSMNTVGLIAHKSNNSIESTQLVLHDKDLMSGKIKNNSVYNWKDTIMYWEGKHYWIGDIEAKSETEIQDVKPDYYGDIESIMFIDRYMDYNQQLPSQPILIAWNTEDTSDTLRVNGKKPLKNSKNIFVKPVSIVYPKDELIELESTSFYSNIDARNYYYEGGNRYYGSGDFITECDLSTSLDESAVLEVESISIDLSPLFVDVSIYNYQTDSFEIVNKSVLSLDRSESEAYITDNKIKLKFSSEEDVDIVLPLIKVMGRVK